MKLFNAFFERLFLIAFAAGVVVAAVIAVLVFWIL